MINFCAGLVFGCYLSAMTLYVLRRSRRRPPTLEQLLNAGGDDHIPTQRSHHETPLD